MDRIFWLGLFLFTSMAVLAVVASLRRSLRTDKPETVSQPKLVYPVDNRLEHFLNGYVYQYFTVSSDKEEQSKQEELLNSYYDFEPDIRQSNHVKLPSELVDINLEYVKGTMALYNVTYRIGDNDDKKEVTVNFGVPFGGKNGKYYVSGLPYFSAVEDDKLSKLNSKKELTLAGRDAVKNRKQLDDFMKVFFDNYTTNQKNLKIVSKDIKAINGAVFKSLDYSYYKKEGKKIKAYIQATFEIAGVTHSENFTFTLTRKTDSYYVEQMEHTIPVDYDKK